MVRVLILYFLSIKSTHGYEIQKFLQVSGTDQWCKVQSGSIYYALTKLEKEKCVEVLREERTGSRIRKIYQITAKGREELQRGMREELAMPLVSVGSPKLMIDFLLNVLSKEEVTQIVTKHVKELQGQLSYWEKWQKIKAGEEATELVRISFRMTIDSLKYQIQWHEELLNHIDFYLESSCMSRKMIQTFDFDRLVPEDTKVSLQEEKLDYVKRIKQMILDDPDNALHSLDAIIEELQKKDKDSLQ